MTDAPRSNDQRHGGPDDAPAEGEHFTEAVADRPATADESAAAERAADDVDLASVAEHEREMAERGANVRGEGQIEPDAESRPTA